MENQYAVVRVPFATRIKFILSETWPFFFSVLVPIIFLPIFFWKPQGFEKAPFGLYMILLMAAYWVSECIPLAITSLIPIAFLPITGIMDTEDICGQYLNSTILFLFGGCVVALAFEYSDLHTRISYMVMSSVGAQPGMLLLGMMMTCMVLSCWMNNTSTTAMMVPIIFAIMDQYKKRLIPTETAEEMAAKYGGGDLNTMIPAAPSKSEALKSNQVGAITENAVTVPDRKSVTDSSAAPESNPANGQEAIVPEGEANKSSVSILMKPRPEAEESTFSSATNRLMFVGHWENVIKAKKKYVRNLELMFLMGVAFASNIGGTGVITGTATNLIAAKALVDSRKYALDHPDEIQTLDYQKCYIDAETSNEYWNLDFARWVYLNFIGMVINTFLSWIFLAIFYQGMPRRIVQFWRQRILRRLPDPLAMKEAEDLRQAAVEIRANIRQKYKDLGPTPFHQWMIIIIFFFLVCMWILKNPLFGRGKPVKFRNPYGYDDDTKKILHPKCIASKNSKSKLESSWGWARFFGDDCDEGYIHDYVMTLFVCILLFSLPKDVKYYKNILRGGIGEGIDDPLLPFEFVQQNLPWGPIIMLGGGLGIANAVTFSKLGDYLKTQLKGNPTLAEFDTYAILGLVLAMVAIVTTIASNTATASIVSPILISLAQAKGLPPLYLVVPPIVGASYAFCLPISTPPNAIVYDKAKMKQMDMFVPGLFLTIICNVVLFLVTITYTDLVLHVSQYPGHCNLAGAKTAGSNSRLLQGRSLIDDFNDGNSYEY